MLQERRNEGEGEDVDLPCRSVAVVGEGEDVDLPCRSVAVVNVHLQGHAYETLARVKQLSSSLRFLSNNAPEYQGVIITGDFNCGQDSACAAYLAFGSVMAGVLEYGREVSREVTEVPPQSHSLECVAYDACVDFTFTSLGARSWCGLLDHIWHSPSSLRCVARRQLFTDEIRQHILTNGLPSAVNPSDHVPVGAVFVWTAPYPDLPSLRIPEASAGGAAAPNDSGLTAKQCPHREADELLAACPLGADGSDPDAQRLEFLAVTTPPFEMVKGKRPTAEQLAILGALKDRKEVLFSSMY